MRLHRILIFTLDKKGTAENRHTLLQSRVYMLATVLKGEVAVIYSYAANEEEADGILEEKNSEDTSALDQNARDFLESAIQDYNLMFHIQREK